MSSSRPRRVTAPAAWALEDLAGAGDEVAGLGVRRVGGGVGQRPSQSLVIAEQSHEVLAQGGAARAGERGEIDHRVGLVAARQGQRVGQHHPPFGVGIGDLDGQHR